MSDQNPIYLTSFYQIYHVQFSTMKTNYKPCEKGKTQAEEKKQDSDIAEILELSNQELIITLTYMLRSLMVKVNNMEEHYMVM